MGRRLFDRMMRGTCGVGTDPAAFYQIRVACKVTLFLVVGTLRIVPGIRNGRREDHFVSGVNFTIT